MDPSTWMDPYSHLRVPGNTQMNTGSHSHSHQFTHDRNLHQINHMTAFNDVNCQKTHNLAKNHKQLNQLSSVMNGSNHSNAQPLVNGHYTTSPNNSWFFNSHQQHPNHDNSIRNHSDNMNSTFNHNPFGLHPHHGVYDASFMSAPFPQQSKSSNYLSSMAAASDFMNHMKKNDPNFRSTSYCSPMKGINMSEMTNSCNGALRDQNLASSSFFSSHALTASATNAWHHQNFVSSNNSNSGALPNESVNIVNSQNATTTSLPRGYNRNSCSNVNNSLNALSNKTASNNAKSHQSSRHINNNNANNQYKGSTMTNFSNMPLNANNSYLMQNFSNNCSGQNSFVGQTIGAKFAAAAAHVTTDHYATFAFAAAQAMNNEYAFQQQQSQKHQQYMSSMNNFSNNTNGHSDYSAVPFDSTGYNSNRQNNGLISYCSNPLFPMTHHDGGMNQSFKSHSSFFDDFSNTNRTTTNVKQPSQKSSRKNASNSKINHNLKPESVPSNMNSNFNEFMTQSSCNNLLNGTRQQASNGVGSTNNNNNVSRCSSVASSHQMQQGGDSYGYNYSPATTNISAHSPYQQRSSTSNSSHSSQNSCAMSTSGVQDYLNYGTPNSAPPTVFPTMAPSQTPTPTPGYPTPPSSVGHSNSRCNSNEELSPFSNNSMSSNISQPYSRNDYKSSASSSSQISPKQVDNKLSDNLQFSSSCMVASLPKVSISNNLNQNKTVHTSSMFSSETLNASYKTQQYPASYQNHLANASTNNLYTNYSTDNPSIQLSQEPLVSNTCSMSTNTNYEYGYQQSQNDEFSQSYHDKIDLPSCAQHASKSTVQSSDSHLIPHLNEQKNDFQSSNQELTSHDNFNLNFDSVIQPIDVNLSEHVDQQNSSESVNSSDIAMDSLNSEKTEFPSIDDLNFMSSQTNSDDHNSVNEKHEYSLDGLSIATNDHVCNQINQCESIDFQSSHNSNPLIENSDQIECNNIQSIIDSLPKSSEHCSSSEKDDHSNELLSGCANEDNFLSDLAPLMNDNSKIALMESTFKSNDLSTIDHDKDLDIDNPSFEKINNQNIFDDTEDLKMHNSFQFSKHETDVDENHFKDVDDFLQTNFKESTNSENVFHKDSSNTNLDPAQQESQSPKLTPIVTNSCNTQVTNSTEKIAKPKKSKKLKQMKYNSTKVEDKSLKRKPSETKCPLPAKKSKANKECPIKNKEIKKPKTNDLPFSSVSQKSTKLIKKIQPAEPKLNNNHEDSTKIIKNTTFKIAEIVPGETNINKIESVKSKPLNKLKNKVKCDSKVKQVKKTSVAPVSHDSVVELKTSAKVNVKENPVKKTKEILPMDTSPNSSDTKENVDSINNAHLKNATKSLINTPTVKPNELNEKPQIKPCKSINDKKVDKVKSDSQKSAKSKPSVGAKKPSISPKQCLKSTQMTSNANTLLTPANLLNASCLNKSVSSSSFNISPTANPALSNVAPTLIVNQSPSVNSYQVSPVTNAVLISIHPANPAPMSSLNAPSTFITLTTQSVTSATSNTTTTTSGTTQSTSSRRRSQDKKVATIREGLMRTGDFVVAEEESHLELPVIWRIEGKSLLQRFEPSEQNGITVYINTSSYSAWNPTVRQKYLGLDVRIMGCNRTRIVVEKLGLTQVKNDNANLPLNEKEESSAIPNSDSPTNILNHLENFEVFIQTLVSQALDQNFIAEIVKENDEYFLSHMQTIDQICNKRRSRFNSKIKWDANVVKCIETFPVIKLHEQSNVGDLRCRLCHDNWSTKILHFEGEAYDLKTLEKLTQVETKQTKIASCDTCTDKTFLYSKLHHQKYNLYLSCRSKVESIQNEDENKESHIVLEECLQDGDWIKMLFKELESILVSCDNIR